MSENPRLIDSDGETWTWGTDYNGDYGYIYDKQVTDSPNIAMSRSHIDSHWGPVSALGEETPYFQAYIRISQALESVSLAGDDTSVSFRFSDLELLLRNARKP
jgi:hypothetical protein